MPMVGLQLVIVVFPDHTHILFGIRSNFDILSYTSIADPHGVTIGRMAFILTLKAPITNAADDKFCDTFPIFRQK